MNWPTFLVLGIVLAAIAVLLACANVDRKLERGEPRVRLAWLLVACSGASFVAMAAVAWPA